MTHQQLAEEQAAREQARRSHDQAIELRDVAAHLTDLGLETGAKTASDAAAEIEGHCEAFGAVVAQKSELDAKLKHLDRNHQHTLDFLARWRELLIALRAEHPNDIRIKRALAGEHPMRPAPWER